MGNNHSKDAEALGQQGARSNQASSSQQPQPSSSSMQSRPGHSRSDHRFLASIRSQAHQDGSQPEHRRETKAEREARRLEKERIAREKERERSMREEHVDGGFLVTMGIYRGTEDFNKAIVRQLQIERRLAPFWRPLPQDPEDLTDAQLTAIARGQPVPPPDADMPPDLQRPQTPVPSPSQSNPNLTVPTGQSTNTTLASGSSTVAVGSPPTSPTSLSSGAPHKPSRSKALAGVLSQGLRSRNNSTSDLAPREHALPHDPFVNGKPLELVLYREAEECPICFSTYPPWLNRTRCCRNLICSECFVQIKRSDPHYPEHHGEASSSSAQGGADAPAAPAATEQDSEDESMLVSEPAQCPYCTLKDFGVTYDPPPFRRGLVLGNSLAASTSQFGSNTAMSSETSLQSATPPASPTSQGDTRRRTQSLSAAAPNVVTTDRIRPDWATKLAQMRSNQARRAAAATALHRSAFLRGQGDRPFSFTRTSRFMRRGSGQLADGSASPASSASHGPEPGPRTSSGPGQGLSEAERLRQFEEVMIAEAIRMSIVDEEERRRKAEKEAQKEAKKREKEERRAARATSVYGEGQGSASRSSLSLGFGRRRGNSGASLRAEATVQGALAAASSAAESSTTEEGSTAASSSGQQAGASSSLASHDPSGKGKGVDRGLPSSTPSGLSTMSSPTQPISMGSRGPSHLRQTSNISSLSSSPMDSPVGSYTDRLQANNPRASGLSVSHSDDGEVSGPMFNFTSMASTLGIDLDRPQERESQVVSQGGDSEATQVEPAEAPETVEASVATLRPSPSSESTPEVRVVGEDAAGAVTASDDAKHPVKDLGTESVVEQRQGQIA